MPATATSKAQTAIPNRTRNQSNFNPVSLQSL